MPSFKGKILLIEEVGEEPYSIDRMLSHFHLAGVFKEVAGVIFGRFHHCVSADPIDGTMEQVIDEWCSRITVPCIRNFPYGHMDARCVMPIGKEICLETSSHKVIL